MGKMKLIAVMAFMALAACQPYYMAPPPVPVGQPETDSGLVGDQEASQIPYRALQEINRLRVNISAPALTLDSQLTAAALAHSRDMSAQNRAWHWGSDGSSPMERARREGYTGELIGQNISESYEDEIQTLSAWMQTRSTRDVIMDQSATKLGFAWYQEPSGKFWWTLLTGK